MMDVDEFALITAGLIAATFSVGLVYSLGNLFNDIMITFEVSRAEAGSVQSVNMASGLTIALLVGVLIQKLGPCKVGMMGAILLSIGISVSFFAKSITYIIISVCLCGGTGVTCVFMSSVTAVGQRFKGRRSIMAVSVLQLGPGIGGVIIPILLRIFVDNFGLRGTFLLCGAMMLNILPIVILYRSPSKRPDKTDLPTTSQVYVNNAFNEVDKPNATDKVSVDGTREAIETISEAIDVNSISANGFDTGTTLEKTNQYRTTMENMKLDMTIVVQDKKSGESRLENNETLHNDDTFTVRDKREGKSSPRKGFVDAIKTVFNNKGFLIYAVGGGITFQAGVNILVFLQDLYLDAGFSKDDATLAILLLNLSSLLGRVSPGLLFAIRFMPTFGVPVISSFITLVASLAVFYSDTLILKHISSCVTGIALGMTNSSFGLMAIRFFDVAHISTAMGVVMTASGIFVLGLGQLSGWLRDNTGSYFSSIMLTTSTSALSVVLHIIGHIWRRTHKEKKQEVIAVTKM